MEEGHTEGGDDLFEEDEDGFGPDLNREETWKELERRGQEEELDEDGFGPDLNRKAVWEELERRGNKVIAEEQDRGLSQWAAGSRADDPPKVREPNEEQIGQEEPSVADVPRKGQGPTHQEEEEGVRKSRGLPSPPRVSRKEREEHARTHTPYRSWCEHCVRGRGMKQQHRRKTEEEKEEERDAIARVSMDYCYMSKADEDEGKIPF